MSISYHSLAVAALLASFSVAAYGRHSAAPHHLPGKNPFVDEVTKLYHLPLEAVLGGAETMYPDFRLEIKDKYVRPEKCARNCGGPGGGGRGGAPN